MKIFLTKASTKHNNKELYKKEREFTTTKKNVKINNHQKKMITIKINIFLLF